ncbi:MAG: radical SAM protein [Candidatus Pacebacteria bacterium]|nr:radical SAM protein [Candidatus Paceibacterota bacterium]
MQRDYELIDCTISICPDCLKRVDAKIINREGRVFLRKHCPEHGEQEELLEDDAEYYSKRFEYNKPGTICKSQTIRDKGCPFDCGLCPDHDQHTCIGLIEVTQNCNLCCPTCYASSIQSEKYLSLDKIEEMLDFFIDTEGGSAEILQISGGEPTLHPQIIDIIKLVRTKNIQYVMLNTNGLRIAEDEEFVKELSQFKGKFEIYLQFDGFKPETYMHLRGKDLLSIKRKAIDNLNKYKIPITLVSVIEKGINDDEVGQIACFGMETLGIRGINFQPLAFFGRKNIIDVKNRVTLTGIISQIDDQTKGIIRKEDFIPLPCNIDRVALTYFYRIGDKLTPLVRGLDIRECLPAIRNTFKFNPEDFLKDLADNAISKKGGCCNYLSLLNKARGIIPKSYFLKSEEEKLDYVTENTFRISISSFVDVYNFDMKSMKKECVHIITPELKKIPFSSYNMFHRGKWT